MAGPENHALCMVCQRLLHNVQQGEADQLHLADGPLGKLLPEAVDLNQHHHKAPRFKPDI
ncbi:hypothetical protein D3C80_1661280 [compost metagenome]